MSHSPRRDASSRPSGGQGLPRVPCAHCRRSFEPLRPDQIYCHPACRQAAWSRRHPRIDLDKVDPAPQRREGEIRLRLSMTRQEWSELGYACKLEPDCRSVSELVRRIVRAYLKARQGERLP